MIIDTKFRKINSKPRRGDTIIDIKMQKINSKPQRGDTIIDEMPHKNLRHDRFKHTIQIKNSASIFKISNQISIFHHVQLQTSEGNQYTLP